MCYEIECERFLEDCFRENGCDDTENANRMVMAIAQLNRIKRQIEIKANIRVRINITQRLCHNKWLIFDEK